MKNTSSSAVARTPTLPGSEFGAARSYFKVGGHDCERPRAPDDVAREFPDTERTVEALRLVVKFRGVKPKGGELIENWLLHRSRFV